MNNISPKIESLIIVFLVVILFGLGFYFSQIAKAQEQQDDYYPMRQEQLVSFPEEPERLSNLRILYQGRLTDPEGSPSEDGRYNLRFRIYDAQEEWGNILWQENYTFYNAILVKESQFKVILGRENPINLNLDEAPFWLGVAVGAVTEEGEIEWGEEIPPRKKITTLSEILGVEELAPEQWDNLSQLIKEKLGEETDIVLLFDLSQLETLEAEEGIDFSSSIISFFQNFINFIDKNISEIGEKINQILTKIDSIIDRLVNIARTLAEMKHKIDILYEVLIIQPGLEPSNLNCSSQYLNLCLTETDCLNAGGYWYDEICNLEPEKQPQIQEEENPSTILPAEGEAPEQIEEQPTEEEPVEEEVAEEEQPAEEQVVKEAQIEE